MRYLILCLFLPVSAVMGAERVVSLSPAVSELIISAGGAKYLCGKSSACDMSEIKGVPVVGDLGMPFTEAILRSGATLVISDAGHPEAGWKLLKRCGVRVEILKGEKLSDLPDNLRHTGKLLNLPGAEKLALTAEKKLDGLRRSMPEKLYKGVIILGIGPLISCGSNTFVSDAVHLSGVRNCAADAGRGYFILTPEFLISSSPEVILVLGVDKKLAERYFQREVFRNIPAVRRGMIIVLDGKKWNRLTPAILDASRELRSTLSGKMQDQLP